MNVARVLPALILIAAITPPATAAVPHVSDHLADETLALARTEAPLVVRAVLDASVEIVIGTDCRATLTLDYAYHFDLFPSGRIEVPGPRSEPRIYAYDTDAFLADALESRSLTCDAMRAYPTLALRWIRAQLPEAAPAPLPDGLARAAASPLVLEARAAARDSRLPEAPVEDYRIKVAFHLVVASDDPNEASTITITTPEGEHTTSFALAPQIPLPAAVPLAGLALPDPLTLATLSAQALDLPGASAPRAAAPPAPAPPEAHAPGADASVEPGPAPETPDPRTTSDGALDADPRPRTTYDAARESERTETPDPLVDDAREREPVTARAETAPAGGIATARAEAAPSVEKAERALAPSGVPGSKEESVAPVALSRTEPRPTRARETIPAEGVRAALPFATLTEDEPRVPPAPDRDVPAEPGAAPAREAPTPRRAIAPALVGLALAALAAAVAAALVPLYSRLTRKDVTEQATRERILRRLAERPGLTPQDLARELGLYHNGVRYHLRVLAKGGLVTSREAKGRVHFFLPGAPEAQRAAEAACLAVPSARALREAAVARPGLTLREAAEATGLARDTVHHQARQLAAAGVVRLEKDGRALRVFPTA